MSDLKESILEVGKEKMLLESKINALISEFYEKTGLSVNEVITTDHCMYVGKIIRSYRVKIIIE